ncbi:MAG: CHAT domain-containing protein, partial [Acidobacteriota bacterium]
AMTQHNLGCSYYARIRGERPENLEEAIFHLQQALEVHSPLTNPAMSRKTAQKLGEACLALQSWDQAAAAFGKAIAADEILYQAALGQVGREIEMAEAGDIYSLAAYASAKAGFLLQALEALEQGRARTLRDALERNRRDLEQLAGHGYAELYRRYQEASRSWQELRRHSTSQRSESTPIHSQARQPELVAELEAAQSEILAIVDEIQQVPGYEDFLRSLPAGSIQALSQQTPLIYLFATSQGGLGLVVSGGVICPVWLDALSYKDLMEALLGPAAESGYLVAYAHWREVITNREASTVERLAATDAWHAAIEAATEWLWKACMKQVVKILQEQRIHQVALIPGGLLGLLPLHAAWTSDARRSSGRRYALDKISFTYAPSAHVLRSAQAGAARPANTLLAIDNPGMDDPELELRFSGEEVASAAEHFESANIRWLVGEAASVDRIKAELSAYQVLHFSTHGLAVPVEPLESFLLLANREKLTLREILELRLDTARLAVLSACETGIPGTTLPDEVVSLPAGLMQAGVPGVIGSLWSVRDASTMMLMARLYDLWRKENYEPPEALRLAQIWLRDTTNGQKEAYFKHSLREHIRMKMSELAPREALHQLLLEDKEDRSFAHPFHWAAFGYMGV